MHTHTHANSTVHRHKGMDGIKKTHSVFCFKIKSIKSNSDLTYNGVKCHGSTLKHIQMYTKPLHHDHTKTPSFVLVLSARTLPLF